MTTSNIENMNPESDKIPISVLIQTKNEEQGIATCLSSLSRFEQVVVFDSNSTDRTQEIARSFGCEVVTFTWNGEYPKKKQAMLEWPGTKYNWVLQLDADERPTERLMAFLSSPKFAAEGDCPVAYDLGLDYVFEDRQLRFGHKVFKRALVDRRRVHFPPVDDIGAPGIGEVEGHYQPVADGRVSRLPGSLVHDDRDPLGSWFARHNKYADWEAYLATHPSAASSANRLRSRNGRAFRRVPLKPIVFFIYDLVLRGGALDGRPGLDYAVAQAWYYWLTERKISEKRRQMRAGHSSV